MSENGFVVFLDKPRTTEIKIHKIHCAFYQNYLKKHGTENTEWHPVLDIEQAEEKAKYLSRLHKNLEWRRANCCFR
jgi:hypothetical protein